MRTAATSVAVPLLSSLPGDAKDVADLSPRVVHETQVVDESGNVAVDVVAPSDEGLELGFEVASGHASRLIDTTCPCQDGLTRFRVDQTIFVGDEERKGNCVAAAVATIMRVPLSEVPHFIDFGIAYGDVDDDSPDAVSTGHHWWAMLLGFLAGKGYWVTELDAIEDAESHDWLLVAGMSPRGVMHQVVYHGRRLWHDPHPSRAGVLDVREVLAVRRLPSVGFDHAPTEASA